MQLITSKTPPCCRTDLPHTLQRASELLDDQLDRVQRLADEGLPSALLEAELTALLKAQMADREKRMELLARTARLIGGLEHRVPARPISRRRANLCFIPATRPA